MSFFYRGITFHKRGCDVILPASPFGRFDFNDNTAEADEEIEVLEGPEVEIVASGQSTHEEDMAMNMVKSKMEAGSSGINSSNRGGADVNQQGGGTEPDNKYYEVEAIIAGPKKRREHLNKVCYKVRWKGYGPEADTWQPIGDLANVPEMIEEYKTLKANEAREKRKKKPKDANQDTSGRGGGHSSSHNSSNSDSDEGLYDPEYGTVKDKFWKDLELGRHQNHAQLFSGDMYSKIKGCRRAAHAEAVANIQKQQQQLQSKSPSSPNPSHVTIWKSSKKISHLRRSLKSKSSYRSDGGRGLSRSTYFQSSRSTHSSPNMSPKTSPTSRPRKRSSDPFSARGYMSAKRSRRSREVKSANRSPDGKRLSVSSVTSETVGIVTTSSPITSIVLPSVNIASLLPEEKINSRVTSQVKPGVDESETGHDSEVDADMDDVFSTNESKMKMVVSSETMLIVTTETRRLNSVEDVHQEENSDTILSTTNVNGGASGDNLNTCLSFDASGATSSGALPESSETNLDQGLKRTALDAQSEASGAVERSHDEDCLWNGACNRSDCKSNRRRNMKKGHGQSCGGEDSGDNESQEGGENSEVLNESTNSGSSQTETRSSRTEAESEQSATSKDKTPGKSSESSSGISDKSGSNFYLKGESVSSFPYDSKHTNQSSSLPRKGCSKTASSTQQHSGSPLRSSGSSRCSLFSSTHGDSSDSSFDEGSNSGGPLSREAVSDSFGCMDALAHRMHMDTLASSTISSRPVGLAVHGSAGKKTKSGEVERSGLFSDSNRAFTFSGQESGFSGSSITPGALHGQFILPSLTGSINLSSPGKENFGSTDSKASGTLVSSVFNMLQSEIDFSEAHSDTSSNAVQSLSNQSRIFAEPSDGRGTRKRVTDASLPLEKIPSPNSRDTDLDRRISTLTCDELEDIVEQGDERYSHKDAGFVTNADLLQAVNLNKAEVVKRAVKQSRCSEHKLDFEQPDNTGFTLLMRAVQKGTVAVVEMLLEQGVSVNAQQTSGMTALMIAAEQNNICLLALLLKHGANSSLYTVHSDQAETALMKAIKRQHREVVNLMLRVGVNIAAPTCTSMSALELAIERRNPQIEGIVRAHFQRLEQTFRSKVLATLEGTAELMEPLFPMQCFPLRESHEFVVRFNSNLHEVARGEGFLLFIAHTKITDKGVRCRFHGGCPIDSVTLNGVVQSPLTKEVNFVTSCHPIIQGCNTLVIHKLADYTSKAKLMVQAFGARLLP